MAGGDTWFKYELIRTNKQGIYLSIEIVFFSEIDERKSMDR